MVDGVGLWSPGASLRWELDTRLRAGAAFQLGMEEMAVMFENLEKMVYSSSGHFKTA
jgi:hypothetical protein